ncbi:MAG: phage late control D family protein [Acidobacteriaceae bacterium]|nr:phage late control D family protein [Acidobacteriaceae bacterium]
MASAPAAQPGLRTDQLSSQDDFYVPAYRVLLNGKDQQQLVQDILSVTFHDSLTEVDSVDLIVNNWDPGDPVQGQAVQGKFRYHNSSLFDPGQQLEIQMGYYRRGKDDLQQMMLGKISSMAPNFPASGGSTLTVRALSLLHQFRTKQKTMQFKNKTDSQIAQQIVQDINKDVHSPGGGKKIPNIKIQMLDQEVQNNIKQNKEKPWPYLEMHNQYPIVFLMQRSREVGYDISVDDQTDSSGLRTVTFHYRLNKSVLRPSYVLVWGTSLISFQPTLQTARQVDAVTVNGWNVQTKQPISKTVKRADLVQKGQKLIMPQDLGMTDNPMADQMEVIVDRGLSSPDEAQQIAERTLLQISQQFIEAKGKTIGVPDLRAGSKVQICMRAADVTSNSPADRFSGIYQVTETTHTFSDSGYTTDFSCRMESKTFL